MVLLMTSLESSEEKGFDSLIFTLLLIVPCGRKASAYFGHYTTEIYTLENVSLRRCSTTSISLWMRWIEGNCILPYRYIIHGLLGLLQKAAEIVPQLRQAQTNWRKCIIAVYIPATGGRTRGEANHPKKNDTYILATKEERTNKFKDKTHFLSNHKRCIIILLSNKDVELYTWNEIWYHTGRSSRYPFLSISLITFEPPIV